MTTARSPLAEAFPWDMVASDYAAELTPGFEKFAADALALVDAAVLAPGARIGDVAAGPGRSASWLRGAARRSPPSISPRR
jgi:hypothetical protein